MHWESSNSADVTEFLDASMVSRVLGDASNAPISAHKQKKPTMETVTEEAAPKGLPTPVRAAINARRVASAKKSTGGKAKQGVPTPLRQAINARRISYSSVAADTTEPIAAAAAKGIPTPIRKAINARRASYGSNASMAPAQTEEAVPKGLPTPVRAAINARRVASAKKSTGGKAKQGVPTPLRQAINARRISYGSMAADSVNMAHYDSTDEDDAAFAAAEAEAAAAAQRKSVPTPIRNAINARRVSYTPGSGKGGVSVTLTQESQEAEAAPAPKAGLPTPVRRSINARRVSYGANSVQLFSSTAPADQATDFDAEEDEDLPLQGVQTEQFAVGAPNAALPTPVRAAINARRVSAASRRRSSVGPAPPSAKSTASSRRASAGSVYAAAGALFQGEEGGLLQMPTPGATSMASRRRSSVGSIPGSVYRWASDLQGAGDDWLAAVATTRSVPTVDGNQHMFFDAHGEMIKCLVEPWAAGAAGDVQPAMHTYFDEDGNEMQTVAVYADEIPAPATYAEEEEEDAEFDEDLQDVDEDEAALYDEDYAQYEEEDAEISVGPHSRFAHRGSFGMGSGEGRPNARQVFSGTPKSAASRRHSSVGSAPGSAPGSAVAPASGRSTKSRRRSSVQSAGEYMYVPTAEFVDAIQASDNAYAAAASLGVEAELNEEEEAAVAAFAQSPAAASVASGRGSLGGTKRRRSVGSAPGSAFKAAAALYEQEQDEEATDGEWESEVQAAADAAVETADEEEEDTEAAEAFEEAAAALEAEVAEGAEREDELVAEDEADFAEGENTLGQVEDEEYYGITHFTTDLATIAETDNEDASTVGTRTPGSAMRSRRVSKTPARSAVKAAAVAAAAIAEEAESETEAEDEQDEEVAEDEEVAAVDFSAMKVAELRAECDARGVDNKGKKAELIARLESVATAGGADAIETEAEEDEEVAAVDFSAMKVAELRAECDARGVDNKGKKAELIARLESVATAGGADAIEAEKEDFESMTYNELRAVCKERGVDSKGKKAELIDRLQSA